MNLETERLFMRPVTARDAEPLHRLHMDPLVVELIMQGKPLTREESDARLRLYLDEWDRFAYGFWMVYLRQESGDLRFVGRAGLRRYDENDVEVGVCLFGAFSGQGIAGEGLGAAIEFAFRRLPVARLVSVVRPTNIRSQRAMEKLGFTFVGVTKHLGTTFRYYELKRPAPPAFL